MICTLSEMNFIKFVLSKARRLEEFHVCIDEDCSKSNEAVVTELVKYRRASPRAMSSLNACQMVNVWSVVGNLTL